MAQMPEEFSQEPMVSEWAYLNRGKIQGNAVGVF